MFGDASMEIFGMAEKITIFQQSNDNDFILESTMLDLPSQALVSVFTEQTIMHLGTEWGDFESCTSISRVECLFIVQVDLVIQKCDLRSIHFISIDNWGKTHERFQLIEVHRIRPQDKLKRRFHHVKTLFQMISSLQNSNLSRKV